MKVISKINTKKLVKGATYEVIKLKNQPNTNSYWSKTVKIKLNDDRVENFSVNNFTLEDGSDLPATDWSNSYYRDDASFFKETVISESNIKVGDYVIYLKNTHANLVTGKKYKVVDLLVNKRGNWTETSLKLEGSEKFYKCYSFRKCTKEEVRKMSLNLLFDGSAGANKIDTKSRKIDLLELENKNELIIRILMTAYLDKNRNNLSVIDWAIQKTGQGYKLNEDDFRPFLELQLEEILK